MKKWLIIKENYVIDAILWDGITEYQYPNPYDEMMEDIEENISIGSWYERSENIFYMPIGIPPDWPTELWDENKII